MCQSMSSCLICGRVGECRPSLRRMYSLNWEESAPPPQEAVIQKPLCCNRSNTCSHSYTHTTVICDKQLLSKTFRYFPQQNAAVGQEGQCSTFIISLESVCSFRACAGSNQNTINQLQLFQNSQVLPLCVFYAYLHELVTDCISEMLFEIHWLNSFSCSTEQNKKVGCCCFQPLHRKTLE